MKTLTALKLISIIIDINIEISKSIYVLEIN